MLGILPGVTLTNLQVPSQLIPFYDFSVSVFSIYIARRKRHAWSASHEQGSDLLGQLGINEFYFALISKAVLLPVFAVNYAVNSLSLSL